MNAESAKPTVLIVEDEEGPRNALKVILRPFFQLYMAAGRQDALRVLREQPVDLVTLDMKLPDGHGLDLLRAIKRERSDVEVVIITGYGKLKPSQEALRYGAIGYLLKPFNVRELITLLNHALEKKRRLDYLRQFLHTTGESWVVGRRAAETWARLTNDYFGLPRAQPISAPQHHTVAEYLPLFSDLLEAASRDLLAHANRVRGYALLMAKSLNLSPDEQQAISLGSFLHDIGRIGMDKDTVSAELTDNREDRHPHIGMQMMRPFQISQQTAHIIACHHERFDGSGYPNGLKGEAVPLLARVVGIAQAFDHLTAAADEQQVLSFEAACEHILSQAGTGFDPRLAQLFVEQASDSGSSLPTLASD